MCVCLGCDEGAGLGRAASGCALLCGSLVVPRGWREAMSVKRGGAWGVKGDVRERGGIALEVNTGGGGAAGHCFGRSIL